MGQRGSGWPAASLRNDGERYLPNPFQFHFVVLEFPRGTAGTELILLPHEFAPRLRWRAGPTQNEFLLSFNGRLGEQHLNPA